ncbi:GRIM-19 domain-containing protein [Dictyostelium discoideum AX4]|uniref:NADH dehydrogenase [ubiquinone] 1 alpha subcomplex subunit 13 n=1 Tax=Dictyostelium discoideum TaxID=44689 RepID=NDUAD_DICDI|nr:GRIM-19 domain-containing protein [Dictyostelium discoideum AX4]Q86IZ2.1 RecName: Full=NADH dehydrogenase [ubiquinone] 1 alpha subcomplex subunit 13 [Dictyostelium discoideum]EAL70048.1 GRIM-19 domain-containing protein [Dictyostelium discoideum AX4]|eukprot:XP_643939.1 GRIM-19 domain-containing protein [Dictyostelium discoideum AX4]
MVGYRQKWVQDLPPAGGFPKLKYARTSTSPIPGAYIFAGVFSIMAVGTYIFFSDKVERNAREEEEKRRLSMILPILQAENDINFLASPHQNVYFTRWMPPQTGKRAAALLRDL